ncbi:bacterio-opsin activator domain-containing protein [Natrinema marinum]|uniref:bacterio-opsin activator domain-containing protein n=1 Tax=Natrinema marinum TaxID=2961598 RepID=UPI0020C8A206|nr:bacterio-opsin activator domain-containing protein [Natrinema marinum]
MNGGAPPAPEGTEELLPILEPGVPYTSREIADELECARTTAYKKLQQLAESGILHTKKVGARGRVWWVPPRVEQFESGSARDASEKQYGELAASEQQFRAVFEEAFDAILIADDDAQYVDANPAACELFGLPREELLGRTIADFAAEGYDVETAWQNFQASDRDRGLFPLVRADGEHRLVEFAATPNILPNRHLSVIRDVTERRKAEKKLEDERELKRQSQETLAADTIIQLEIQIEDDVFSRFSAELSCSCEFEGMVSASEGGLLQYVTVAGAPPEAVQAMAAESPEVDEYRVVFESDRVTLLELALAESPIQTLVEAGASGHSMRTTGGLTTVIAELGAHADLQQLLNEVETEYPGAEVVAKRILDRPVTTTRQYRESLTSDMTDRQAEVFRAAYLAGYFEWPRNSQAETIAASMGIAASTWLRHLRLAEGKVARWFFEELDD